MEIQYLQKLKENDKIDSQRIKGVTESEIQKVEQKLEISFPKAYKEYLYLAGEYSGNLHMLETDDLKTLSSDFYKDVLSEDMRETKTIIERPFWVFADGIGDQGFWFFYLDENDENPETHYYAYKPTYVYEAVIGSHNLTFSEFIEGRIDFGFKVKKDGIW